MPRGNPDKLTSLGSRSEEEKREIARKGGIASGESKRKKKLMREMLLALLEEKEPKSGKTYRELVTLGLFKGAIKGNAMNYKAIVETLGELKIEDEDKLANSLGKVEDLLTKLNDEAKK